MASAALISRAWTVGRWALAAALVVAGGLKVAQPATFVTDLENYRLLPIEVAFALGLYLPWLEIVTAAALVSRRWRLAGWLIAAVLGLGFVVFVGSAWARGLDVSCGCFGGAATPVGPVAAARALGIFAFAVAGFFRDYRAAKA